METRVAVISMIVENPASVEILNGLLHEYSPFIIGRMGIPYPKRGVSIITVAMDAPQNTISSLSGKLGGIQQITARVACDEVDLVLFFRDPLRADSGSSNEQNLLRLCDMHSVPIATNIATAEVLLRGMDQGDLDYREGMHPPVIEPLAAPRRAVC